MRDDPLYLAWDMRCPCREGARTLEQVLRREARPDAVFADVVTTGVPPAEKHAVTSYRLGDFFRDVIIFPGVNGDACSFRVVFARLPTAGRFWKDLMMRLLRAARAEAGEVSVNLVYRGDEPLDWEHYRAA